MVEIVLDGRAGVDQEVPISCNGFLYVIHGSVLVGEEAALLKTGQVGWLDRPDGDGMSVVRVAAGEESARLVLYTGQPQGDRIVSHGPFIGDSRDDIIRLYTEYRAGRFKRMSDLARMNIQQAPAS
jgi:redox-sensitive bicupin YhaK (pirin superfamily)